LATDCGVGHLPQVEGAASACTRESLVVRVSIADAWMALQR